MEDFGDVLDIDDTYEYEYVCILVHNRGMDGCMGPLIQNHVHEM